MIKNKFFHQIQSRKYCNKVQQKVKLKVELDEKTDTLINEENLKFRKHPGVVQRATLILPEWIKKAAESVLAGYPKKQLVEDSRKLYRHLNGRLIPLEDATANEKLKNIKKQLYIKLNIAEDSLVKPEIQKKINQKAAIYLKSYMNHWSPTTYDKYHSILYLVGRSAYEYAILYKILYEIKTRDAEFQPQTLFDFGSGIGTVSWVASELWQDSLKEYVCIDSSEHMNELAQSISTFVKPKIKNIFYRQYFPYAPVPTYDIVVSSFTFLELPSRKIRIETLCHLWQKTNKYLVLVEQGTNAGYQLINEARNCILNVLEKLNQNDSYEAHIFSPCPHEFTCPRLREDDTPCNFEVSLVPFPISKDKRPLKEKYSYIIIRKGQPKGEKDFWPRIVRPVLNRSNHTICRMCTAEGNLQEIIFTKGKFQRNMYRCARSSRWGDRLPMKISKNDEEQSPNIVEDINDKEQSSNIVDDINHDDKNH